MKRNITVNLLIICLTIALAYYVSYWFLLTPIIVHALNDFVQYTLGWSIFSQDEMVQRAYQTVHRFLEDQSSKGIDLGFNFYEGDLKRKPDEAQKAKWEYMLSQLGLKAGDRLIDIGCGYGDWLKYARSKGIKVVGVNLTKEQAEFANKKNGLDVKNVNWKQILVDPSLQKELYGKFDAVTFMDTVEHYVPATARKDTKAQQVIYENMFLLAHKLLNPKSDVKKVFISCLHQNIKKWDLRRIVACYFLNRSMSGFYPIGDDGLTKHSTKYFTEVNRVDRTEDYRLTGVVNKEHFTSNNKKLIDMKKIFLGLNAFIVDPYFAHRLIQIKMNNWNVFYGEDPFALEYNPKRREELTYVKLWMLTLKGI